MERFVPLRLFTIGSIPNLLFSSTHSSHEIPGPAEDHLVDLDHLEPRLPRSVQAVYLRPLKRQAKYGVPACDLQLRSYSVRNVEFFADFAVRAAYYLNLPAAGPIPLPRITERWTVPRSNFIHKKSQENFERITLRRMVQIQDGHPDTVQIWLAFLRKHAYYGVGMKANIWEYEKLGMLAVTLSRSVFNIWYRSWEDNGCQLGKFAAGPRAQMGTFWEEQEPQHCKQGYGDAGYR